MDEAVAEWLEANKALNATWPPHGASAYGAV
jgi:hypothetical protein